MEWYYGIDYHRIGGPAHVKEFNGSEECSEGFFIAGTYHNLNSYADKSSSERYKDYYLVGNLHNITGPARVSTFYSIFYINGTAYTEEEYNRILKVKNA